MTSLSKIVARGVWTLLGKGGGERAGGKSVGGQQGTKLADRVPIRK